MAKAQLEYWIKANTRVKEISNRNKKGMHLLFVNLSELCFFPERAINKILDFIEVKVSSHLMEKLVSIPKLPKTTNRYLGHDLSIFSESQIDFVRAEGFELNL